MARRPLGVSGTERVDYGTYMASREWRLKRKQVIARADGLCERCFDADIRDVHHLTYERLGNEDIDTDVIGVCRSCHEYLSGERNDDPATVVVKRLMETHGIGPTLMEDGNWSRLLSWDVGPTSRGRFFHGGLFPTASPQREWGDYMDATKLVIEIDRGVWYHCNSY